MKSVLSQAHDHLSLQAANTSSISNPHDVLTGSGHINFITLSLHHLHWNSSVYYLYHYRCLVVKGTPEQHQYILILQGGWGCVVAIGSCNIKVNALSHWSETRQAHSHSGLDDSLEDQCNPHFSLWFLLLNIY